MAKVFAVTRSKKDFYAKMPELNPSDDRVMVMEADLQDEDQLRSLVGKVCQFTDHLDLLVVANGILHNKDMSPEKSLKELNPRFLMDYFLVNSLLAPLLAKHFWPLLRGKKPSSFVSISAKVGSIEDNHLGGWYGYRASKAALNMFTRCIHLEAKRNKCSLQVLTIHPGTTVSELSKPYIKNSKLKLHEPSDTAKNILKVIDKSPLSLSGKFISWDGSLIPF